MFSSTFHLFGLTKYIHLHTFHNNCFVHNKHNFLHYMYNLIGSSWQHKIPLRLQSYSSNQYIQQSMLWKSLESGIHRFYNIEQIGSCILKQLYIAYNSFQRFFLVIFSSQLYIQYYIGHIFQKVNMSCSSQYRIHKF